MAEVTMPRLSDTMEEGTIASWLKKPGEQVKRGEVIAQIETDKATMDLTAFEAGTLQEILAPEGTTVAIGQPVARIGSGNGSAKAASPAKEAAPPAKDASAVEHAPAAKDASAVEDAPPAQDAATPAEEAKPPAAEAPPSGEEAPPSGEEAAPSVREATAEAEPATVVASDGKTRASPMARHLAAEHGLNLSDISGSGPQGRVIRADVEAALSPAEPTEPTEPAQSAEPTEPAQIAEPTDPAQPTQPTRARQPAPEQSAVPSDGDDERVSLSQMRRTIARRMADSTRTVPHFFLTTTVDASDLVKLRKQILDQTADAGMKISFNDLVVKAAALALRQVPEVNVSFAEDSLLHHRHIHIGVAVATKRGLIVPVIRDVDQKSLSQISRESRDLAERANSGKLQPADYSGGTFTISNLGMFGVEQFNAVINPPESAILAVGAISREPAEHEGEIVLREHMKLTLSVDHRALDGATGARYLQALKQFLEKPMLLLV